MGNSKHTLAKQGRGGRAGTYRVSGHNSNNYTTPRPASLYSVSLYTKGGYSGVTGHVYLLTQGHHGHKRNASTVLELVIAGDFNRHD